MGILIYIEDPGAANVAARLPVELAVNSALSRMVAGEPGAAQLRRLGVDFELAGAGMQDALASGHTDLLVVGTSENPDSRAFVLVEGARKQGIETVGLVDSASNAGYRFRGRTDLPLAYAPDWLVVPDARIAAAYSELGFPVDRIFVGGHPHYDLAREVGTALAKEGAAAVRKRVMPEAAGNRQVLTFLAEPSSGLNPSDFQRNREYRLSGNGDSNNRTEIVLEEVLLALGSMSPKPYLILRLHPKDAPEDYSAYLSAFDWVSQSELALDVVFASDAVVGLATSLLIEAAYIGVPALSVLPREKESEWLGTAASALPCVFDRPEIAPALSAALNGSRANMAILEQLHPSGASKRIASFLAARLEQAGNPELGFMRS